jgi:thymidine phosphorylase
MGLGAGRAIKQDTIRHDTGVVLRRVHGDEVARGEPLAEVHAGSEADAERAERALLAAIAWSDEPPPPRCLVHDHVGPRDHELTVP